MFNVRIERSDGVCSVFALCGHSLQIQYGTGCIISSVSTSDADEMFDSKMNE